MIYTIEISVNDLFKSINELDIHKGTGPDSIPSVFVKNCNFMFSYIFEILYKHQYIRLEIKMKFILTYNSDNNPDALQMGIHF